MGAGTISKVMLEKDEEILWRSTPKFYFQTITFLISLAVVVFSIVTGLPFNRLLYSDFDILLALLFIISLLITVLSFFGIIYTTLNWLFAKSSDTIEYFATNKKIVEKCENKEYIEYFTFEYSKIIKIEIQRSFFFKKRGVCIRIFPEFNRLSPYDWKYHIFKGSGVKVPQPLKEAYHVLYSVSDYEPLFKLLEKNHVKIIDK